jgi:hypothetical protein
MKIIKNSILFLLVVNGGTDMTGYEGDVREYVLSIVQELDPRAYVLLCEDSPDEMLYLTYESVQKTATVFPHPHNGRPCLKIGVDSQEPRDQTKFRIAHELSHYVLGHLQRGEKLSRWQEGLLSRGNELEADMYAIEAFGASRKAAIQWMEKRAIAEAMLRKGWDIKGWNMTKNILSDFLHPSHPTLPYRMFSLENSKRRYDPSLLSTIDWEDMIDDYNQANGSVCCIS